MEDNIRGRGGSFPDEPESAPDGGYGWVVVGSCFILNCLSWGITASFGIYLSEYISSGMLPEAGSFAYGLIGGLNFTVAMLLAPLATMLTRKFGVRAVVFSGSFLQGSGYVAASFALRPWQLYLSQGLLVGWGIGFMIIPSTAVLSQWFLKKRSVVNGIASAGSGVGGAIFAWGSAAMIQHLGLAWSLRITGLASIVATAVAALLLRDRNPQVRPTQMGLDFKLLRQSPVVLLLLWAFVTMFGYITLLFSLSDFATAIGLSRAEGTDIIGFLNIGTVVGRPIIGLVSDRVSKVKTAGTLTFACGIACFALWIPTASFGLLVTFAVVCGAILGVFWMVAISFQIAGLRNLPSLLSLSWVTIAIPTASAEVIALRLRDVRAPRPYIYAQIFAGLSYIIASGFMLALSRVLQQR